MIHSRIHLYSVRMWKKNTHTHTVGQVQFYHLFNSKLKVENVQHYFEFIMQNVKQFITRLKRQKQRTLSIPRAREKERESPHHPIFSLPPCPRYLTLFGKQTTKFCFPFPHQYPNYSSFIGLKIKQNTFIRKKKQFLKNKQTQTANQCLKR